MNYTKVEELYGNEYQIAPRFGTWCHTWNNDNTYTDAKRLYGAGYVHWIDLEREAEIGVGTSWPYNDLASDECVLDEIWRKNNDIEVGDKVAFGLYLNYFWKNIGIVYNEYVVNDGEQKVNPNSFDSYALIECTVRGFVDDSVSGQKFTSTKDWTWGRS